MSNQSLRTRIKLLIAVVGFTIAMLIGGGAPADFVDYPKEPATPPPPQSAHP